MNETLQTGRRFRNSHACRFLIFQPEYFAPTSNSIRLREFRGPFHNRRPRIGNQMRTKTKGTEGPRSLQDVSPRLSRARPCYGQVSGWVEWDDCAR